MKIIFIFLLASLLSFSLVLEASDDNNDYYNGYYETVISATTIESTLSFSDEAYYVYVEVDNTSLNDLYITYKTVNAITSAYRNDRPYTYGVGSHTRKILKGHSFGVAIHCSGINYKSDGTCTGRVVVLSKKQSK